MPKQSFLLKIIDSHSEKYKQNIFTLGITCGNKRRFDMYGSLSEKVIFYTKITVEETTENVHRY